MADTANETLNQDMEEVEEKECCSHEEKEKEECCSSHEEKEKCCEEKEKDCSSHEGKEKDCSSHEGKEKEECCAEDKEKECCAEETEKECCSSHESHEEEEEEGKEEAHTGEKKADAKAKTPAAAPGPRTHWIPDGERNNCLSCKVAFSLTNRRHHCRLCGDIFCNDCSIYRGTNKYFPKQPTRMCYSCMVVQGKEEAKLPCPEELQTLESFKVQGSMADTVGLRLDSRIEAEGNTDAKFKSCILAGLSSSGNGHYHFHHCLISSEEIPLVLTGNNEVHLEHCVVAGSTAISLQGNSQLKAEKCWFVGKKVGLALSGNSKVELKECVVSSSNGITAEGNSKVTVEGGIIAGQEAGLISGLFSSNVCIAGKHSLKGKVVTIGALKDKWVPNDPSAASKFGGKLAAGALKKAVHHVPGVDTASDHLKSTPLVGDQLAKAEQKMVDKAIDSGGKVVEKTAAAAVHDIQHGTNTVGDAAASGVTDGIKDMKKASVKTAAKAVAGTAGDLVGDAADHVESIGVVSDVVSVVPKGEDAVEGLVGDLQEDVEKSAKKATKKAVKEVVE